MLEIITKALSWFKLIKSIYVTFSDWAQYYIRDRIYYQWFNKEAFYFKEYHKHLTVYRNGHGILITTCHIRVLNKDTFDKFSRTLDISDAKPNARFKQLKAIKKDLPCDRFKELGFWYFCDTYNNYKLIECIEDNVSANNKIIDFTFKFNKRVLCSLPKKNIFVLSYAFSIPDLFPLKDGSLDIDNLPQGFEQCASSLEVEHRIEKLKYTISFEKGIRVDNSTISFIKSNQKKNTRKTCICKEKLKYKFEHDIFYDKYILDIKSPKYKSQIIINWDIIPDDIWT